MTLNPMDRTQPVDHYIRLTGRPPISDFVRYMKRNTVNGHDLDDAALTQEWREASERVAQVSAREAGLADTDDWPGLPSTVAAQADEELAQSAQRRGLAYLPHRWAMVELDRLLVFQTTINLRFVDNLKRTLPLHPAADELVRIALGDMREVPDISVTQVDSNTFSFASASNDLRVLGVSPFDAGKVADEKLVGSASSVLGVFIGYGSNLLQAIRIRKRTILTNGSHRAYALRAKGLTHVPCLVQDAREDELELIGIPEVTRNFDRYLTAPRPPLFKDYFDSRLHKIVSVPRRNLLLQVEMTIKESMIPSL